MDGKLKKPDANSTYPSPCVGCEHNINDSCKKYMHCDRWLTRYRYRQRQINAVARKLLIPKFQITHEFVYDNYDETKDFLENGPCKKCPLEPSCDFLCKSRLIWWDLRMKLLRKDVGL